MAGLLLDGQLSDSLLDSLVEPQHLAGLCPPMQVQSSCMSEKVLSGCMLTRNNFVHMFKKKKVPLSKALNPKTAPVELLSDQQSRLWLY